MAQQEVARRLDPIEDLVGDLFVDRQEEMALFWQWGANVPHPMRNSWALIGRRRTGKTAILTKLFNRLFWEQEQVLPVFISFAQFLNRKEPLSSYEFADHYFTGYMGSYLAFRYRKPILLREQYNFVQLQQFATQVNDSFALDLFEKYKLAEADTIPFGLVKWVILFPKGVAASQNMPTAILIDEFQVLTDIYDPVQKIHHDLTDSFQGAVDTRWAPLLVSGSAVTVLEEEALGGLLSGRFNHLHLKPLLQPYVYELIFRLGQKFKLAINDTLAEAIWQLVGGYPYSVESLLTSRCPAVYRYPDLEALHEVMVYELSHVDGNLQQHYRREFAKYKEMLNGGQLTKKVMFWAVKYPDERIDTSRIAETIGVTLEEVNEALFKLNQIDLVYRSGWALFQGISDPMLRRYIEYNYRQEIESLSHEEAIKDWRHEYNRLRGQMNHLIGHFAEGYLYAIMSAFDGRTVDGQRYFATAGPVLLPHFTKIERRSGVVATGRVFEIDLLAEYILPNGAGEGLWLVQSKYTQDPANAEAAQAFLVQAEKAAQRKPYAAVTRWYFAKQGFTAEAAATLQTAGVLTSDLAAFNQLARLLGFVGLPG
jgi:hypothetical protein